MNRAEQLQDLRKQASEDIRHNRLDAAQEALQTLVREAPEDTPACLELADIMYRRGQIRGSSAPLLAATQHLPRHAPLLMHLVQHLIARGEIVAARHCLDFLSQAPEPPPELLMSMAQQRFNLGEITSALDLTRRALESGADRPADHHMYAMLLQFSGDIEEACSVLEECLQRWPNFGDAIVPLVSMRKQTDDSNHLAQIDRQLDKIPGYLDEPDAKFNRAEFDFARFKVLDKLGRYDEAWRSLTRCNRTMHELNPYDADGESGVADAFAAVAEAIGAASPAEAEIDGPMPIFIVGMPRSGTSLLDRMLSSHSEVATAGELIEFWRQLHWVADVMPARTHSLQQIVRDYANIDFAEVGARYLEHTRWRANGRRYFIDKLPANIQMVGFIRRALPHARILHMVREPMDVCFSNYKAFFGNDSSAYSYDMDALTHFYSTYRRMCDLWHAHLPGAMLDVPYADLVGDTEATMQKVLGHCGLAVEAACLSPENNAAPIATPSSAQVREPIHDRSIGEWRHYAAPLESLRQRLGE